MFGRVKRKDIVRVWCFGRPGAWRVIGLVCYGESRCALPWVSDLKGGV